MIFCLNHNEAQAISQQENENRTDLGKIPVGIPSSEQLHGKYWVDCIKYPCNVPPVINTTIPERPVKTTPLPPMKQIKNGIYWENVTCKDDFVLIENLHTESVACVKISTAQKLIDREKTAKEGRSFNHGWALIKNPNVKMNSENSNATRLSVIRDIYNEGNYPTLSGDKLSSYPDLMYAMSIADIDYDNTVAWEMRTGCQMSEESMCPIHISAYLDTIGESEARKMISDLGLLRLYQNQVLGAYDIIAKFDEKLYTISIVNIGTLQNMTNPDSSNISEYSTIPVTVERLQIEKISSSNIDAIVDSQMVAKYPQLQKVLQAADKRFQDYVENCKVSCKDLDTLGKVEIKSNMSGILAKAIIDDKKLMFFNPCYDNGMCETNYFTIIKIENAVYSIHIGIVDTK